MADSRWIRLNVDWDESEWIAALAWEYRGLWPIILGYVKTHGFAGCCKRPNINRLAAAHDVPGNALLTVVTAAISDGAIIEENDSWRVVNWKRYQGDGTNADRQSRFKSRKREAEGNGGNALGNGVTPTVTVTSINIETKSKQEVIPTFPASASPQSAKRLERFEEIWKAFESEYPKRRGDLDKKKARDKLKSIIASGKPPGKILAGVKAYREFCDREDKTGTPLVAMMTTWLNGERWCEDYGAPAKPDPYSHLKSLSDDDKARIAG